MNYCIYYHFDERSHAPILKNNTSFLFFFVLEKCLNPFVIFLYFPFAFVETNL